MEVIITSVIAFISTNIDDLFILTVFYGNKRFRHPEILGGQLLGISALIGISLIASLLGLLIGQAYIGLLGLIPIFLGAKGIWKLLKEGDDDDEASGLDEGSRKSKLLTVAGVTIANGGDNIGIYVPLFATFAWGSKMAMIIIFLLMTFVWCAIARYFVKHPYVAKAVDRYGQIVTPFVLVLLGLFILYENGSFGLLAEVWSDSP